MFLLNKKTEIILKHSILVLNHTSSNWNSFIYIIGDFRRDETTSSFLVAIADETSLSRAAWTTLRPLSYCLDAWRLIHTHTQIT